MIHILSNFCTILFLNIVNEPSIHEQVSEAQFSHNLQWMFSVQFVKELFSGNILTKHFKGNKSDDNNNKKNNSARQLKEVMLRENNPKGDLKLWIVKLLTKETWTKVNWYVVHYNPVIMEGQSGKLVGDKATRGDLEELVIQWHAE